MVRLLDGGVATITASQLGGGGYDAAVGKTFTINVNEFNLYEDSVAGLSSWWDGTDVNADGQAESVSDFTQINGVAKVDVWSDRSGNGNHLSQSDPSKMPDYLASLGNSIMKPFVAFGPTLTSNEATHLQGNLAAALKGSPSITVLVAAMSANDSSSNLVHFGATSGTSGQVLGLTQDSSFNYNNGKLAFDGNFMNAKTVGVYRRSNPSTYADGDFFRNGSALVGTATNGSNTLNIPSTGNREVLLGSGRGATGALNNFFDGAILEVLVFDVALDDWNIRRLEGYLGHKWGFAGSLPAAHAFRNQPPSFGGLQSIVFEEEDAIVLGSTANNIAYATSGLPLTFVSSDPSVIKVENGELVALKEGTATITAKQTGDSHFSEAVEMSHAFTVERPEVINPSLVDLSLAGGSVAENLPAGAFAGVVSAVFSGQGETSPVSFSLVPGAGGDDNALFTLEANGTLRTVQALDFETKDSHSVRVRAEANATSREKAFAVSVIDAFVPIVDTIEPKAGATEGTFLLGGEVLDDGSSHVSTERGFVLGRSPDPEPGGFGVTALEAGLGLGAFEATPSNLVAGKKYYYRAFAKNAEGVSYGSQERFTAAKEPVGPAWASAFASGQAADWWTSPWLGSFFLGKNGWLRHETIGWLFAVDDGAGGVWFWQENLGWLWTAEGVYPYLFLNAEKGWGFLLGDTAGRVFIYRFADSSWFDVAEGMESK
jgi:hypothetical protein